MKRSQEIKIISAFLKLAQNPSHNSVRYKWLSIFLSGIGWLLVISSLIGLSKNYEPVKHLVWCAIFGGFFGAYAIFLNASSIQGRVVGHFLDEESLTKRLKDLEDNT